MNNVKKIFLGDAYRLRKNVVALIIVVGLSIMPCFYAWFNIAASWDPYSSTGDVKIAVTSNDEGYQGTILPVSVNIGDEVLSNLHSNNKLGWTFVTEEEARSGVESGEYYAAIIIPEDFSKKMMSVFSEEIQHPTVEYYYNAKKNAISPKVTGKGSTTVKTTINESFNASIDTVLLTVLKSIDVTNEDVDVDEVANNLVNNLDSISADIQSVETAVGAFASMTDSIESLLVTTDTFLTESQSALKSNMSSLEDDTETFDSLENELDASLDSLEVSMEQTEAVFDTIATNLEQDLDTASADAKSLGTELTDLAGTVDEIYAEYDMIDQELTVLEQEYPEYADTILDLQMSVQNMKGQQLNLKERLLVAADACQTSPDQANASLKEIISDLKTMASTAKTAIQTYRDDIKGRLQNLASEIDQAQSSLSILLGNMDSSVTSLENISGDVTSKLNQLSSTLGQTESLLQEALTATDDLKTEIQKGIDSEDYDSLKKLISGDTSQISKFLSSPISLNTIKVYPVENYGSAMAPFYSALSIWVGGIVLVAMLKVKPSEEVLRSCENVKQWQIYFGRYIIFLILGLIQTTLICLGDLYFLGIQCLNPFLFLVAGWLASIVYVNIIYTLTISFGDVGKAAAVVLMVMQVAGSGGTFPIETTPKIFQKIFPLLPFGHTMTMMRETIGGLYQSTYLQEAGILGIFLLASLFLGLVLRKPLIKLTDYISERLESTNLIE